MTTNSNTRGKFISIEGVEGVGKSTNLAFLVEWLRQQQFEVETTREPGGTPMAEQIREVLLSNRDEAVPGEAELLLMFAARKIHLQNHIQPLLASGKWVVSDRFVDASYAYQGAGRGIDLKRIEYLENWLVGDARTDLTLILDAPLNVGRQRIQARSDLDRIENEETSFFERTRAMYLQRAEQQPERYRVIDANQPLQNVQADIIVAVTPFLDNQ